MDLDAPPYVQLPRAAEQTALTILPARDQAAVARLERDPRSSGEMPLLAFAVHTRLPQHAATVLGLPSTMGDTALVREKRKKKAGDGGTPRASKKQVDLLGPLGGDSAQDGLLLGRPLPLDVILAAASDRLRQATLTDAAATLAIGPLQSTRGVSVPLRLGTPGGGPVANYKQWMSRPTADVYEAARVAYFADDRFAQAADETPMRGYDATTLPALAVLVQQAARAEHDTRTMLEDALGDVPRPAIEELNRAYFTPFRMPPTRTDVAEGRVRLCRRGNDCVFNISGMTHQCYVGREFLLPRERGLSPAELQAVKPRPGHCIDCLLVAWTTEAERAQKEQIAPARTLNTFSVLCKPGEYGEHVMLSRTRSGIVGKVPRYSANYRAYLAVPQSFASEMGLPAGSYYYAEVNMDFH